MFTLSVVHNAGALAASASGVRAPRATTRTTATAIPAAKPAPVSLSFNGNGVVGATARRGSRVVMAAESGSDMVSLGAGAGLGGDIGARDATAGELESNFNSKSIGEADTEHMNKVPTQVEAMLALRNRNCCGNEDVTEVIPEKQCIVYSKQVLDWKIRKNEDGHEVLRREWRTADKELAAQVVSRVSAVCESEGQRVDTWVEGPGLRVELTTRKVKGLHVNNFIMAAKIEQLDMSDIVIKKKPNVFLM
mmetsp:Transcript_29384/g.72735  ORF Transcript_29384/g.72735 Transcript_29384/m.72735 type:complete len:249 (-) Transcript_29384:68-814(-)